MEKWLGKTIYVLGHFWRLGLVYRVLKHVASSELHFGIDTIDRKDFLFVINVHSTYQPQFRFVKRLLQVTITGCLFIVAGLVGLVYHLSERPLDDWIVLISMIRIIAVVGGVFLLMGHNWARWLMLAGSPFTLS
jgi:hypothetical protein